MSVYVDLVDDTICALITTPGLSGISVVRVSGQRAFKTVKSLCLFLPKVPESHRVYFGKFRSLSGEVIDECLVSYFQKGKSFTGDETLEISVHGGVSCADRVLTELVNLGCRAAERGEFSFRAFYNGKIDLVQAEAIHSLIKSRNDLSRAQAVQQLGGRVSQKIHRIEEGLLHILAQIEASIDFSTEDIEPYSLEMMAQSLQSTCLLVQELVAGFSKGRRINDGLKIALAGAPNSGKSSLYNVLLGQDKAIVSATPGTTRDVLESPMNDFGSPMWLLDTAGLRETDEDIEKRGIQKTREKMESSDLILFLLDVKKKEDWDISMVMPYLDKVLFIISKVDQLDIQVSSREEVSAQVTRLSTGKKTPQIYYVSSKTNEGIQELKLSIEKMGLVDIHHDESVITQYRQFDHLNKSLSHIQNSLTLLKESASYDLLALEVQTALREIFHLLGKEFDEQVLDRVFKQFCIGK